MVKEEYGSGEAFVNLRRGIYNYLKNNTTIENCYAVVKYIDELVPIEMGYSVINRLLFREK
ncbi:MAG: hypothetical protein R3Y24_09160 [Eubacteriales bacterium]